MIDERRLNERLVALNIDEVSCGREVFGCFGKSVGSSWVLGGSHGHFGTKSLRGFLDPSVIGGDYDLGEILALADLLVNMLQ